MTLKDVYNELRFRLRERTGIAWGTMRWTAAHEAFRYWYDLDHSSVVFDLGGYLGEWSRRIYSMYAPRIWIFEPIAKHAQCIKEKFKGVDSVKVFNYGLSGKTRTTRISHNSEASSEFDTSHDGELVRLKNIVEFCTENHIDHIDLMKINIEGGEFELLEQIISSGFVNKIDNIQVQFHRFMPHARSRMQKLRKQLAVTHRPTYRYSFNWDNWKRK